MRVGADPKDCRQGRLPSSAQPGPASAHPHQPNPSPAARAVLEPPGSGDCLLQQLLQRELTKAIEVRLEQEGETPAG